MQGFLSSGTLGFYCTKNTTWIPADESIVNVYDGRIHAVGFGETIVSVDYMDYHGIINVKVVTAEEREEEMTN